MIIVGNLYRLLELQITNCTNLYVNLFNMDYMEQAEKFYHGRVPKEIILKSLTTSCLENYRLNCTSCLENKEFCQIRHIVTSYFEKDEYIDSKYCNIYEILELFIRARMPLPFISKFINEIETLNI